MPYRFGALVHSEEVAEAVRREADMLGMTVQTLVTSLDDAAGDAGHLLEQDACEILLCHGHCRHIAFRRYSKNTVFIERSDIDLLSALLEARKVSPEVMLTAHKDEPRDIALMERLLGMRIHLVAYTNQQDMLQLVRERFAEGIHVAVGGGVTNELMETLGGVSFLDVPQPQNIRDALNRAVTLALRNRMEAAQLADFKDVLQHIKEGVLCINAQKALIYSNSRARELLKTPLERQLDRHFDALGITQALSEGAVATDMITTIGGERLLVNTFPVARHSGRSMAVALIHDVASLQKIHRKIGDKLYAQGFRTRFSCADMVGNSPPMRTFQKKLKLYAATDTTIFIQGETGTGKELAAHAVHHASSRRDQPFVAINCAALPETLLESELFGYEEGAFTGAKRGGKPGLFELADKGTLFLDEIGEISHRVQLRLLRALEAREIMRVGGDSVICVDVRVVSASHQPLGLLANQGKFRMDLFYRLMGLYLHMPPLRERSADIPLLLDQMLDEQGRRRQAISPRMRKRLMECPWPGNVRELLAIVRRYLVLLPGDKADDTLFDELLQEQQTCFGTRDAQQATGPLKERMEAYRTRLIQEALHQHHGDKKMAARELGVSFSTLHRLLAACTV